jgi:hypothetical protein
LFWGTADNAHLGKLMDSFQQLFAQRVVSPGTVNIGYANRFEQARSTLGDKTADMSGTGDLWNFYIIYDGSTKLSKAITEELQDGLAPCCLQTGHYVSGENPDSLPPHMKPVVVPLSGFPDYESIRMVYKLTGVEPPANPLELDVDYTPFGKKTYMAVVPPLGEHFRKAADIIAGIREKFKVNIKPSFFGDGRFLTTIHFVSSDPKQVTLAEQAEIAMWNGLTQAGYMPYRLSIDQMERAILLKPDVFDLIAQIKTLYDPNDIISPGRYCPVL